jgi:pentatricopeptide repeat protein
MGINHINSLIEALCRLGDATTAMQVLYRLDEMTGRGNVSVKAVGMLYRRGDAQMKRWLQWKYPQAIPA